MEYLLFIESSGDENSVHLSSRGPEIEGRMLTTDW